MGKNQAQVFNTIKTLGSMDIKQITPKTDLWESQVRTSLRKLMKFKLIKICGHRDKTKLSRTPLNVYEVI